MGTAPVLAISNLSVKLRGKTVLQDIDLSLAEGDFIGIIGPNGGGKTTLLKTILGLYEPSCGRIEVFGKTPQQARGLLGYVPQFAHFDPQFPIGVRDAILMGRLHSARLLGPYSRRDLEISSEILKMLELQDLARQQIGKLSGGQMQRVLIGRALAMQPRILLLDEPTASLDTRMGRGFYELLEALSRTMTIMLVTHDIGVIARHVKTIACLNTTLHYHHSREITPEIIQKVYGCPVDLLAHGHAHRVLENHKRENGE